MTPTMFFNLLDEPWIPVVSEDGGFEEVGLLDLFGRASALRSIWSADAMETLALHRVAIAVMLAALTSPESPRGRRRDLSARRIDAIDEDGLPIQAMLDYLESQRDRFWLFGPEAFWQLGASENSPVARLDPLRAVGTQPAFFDHQQDLAPASLSPAAAARVLAVAQVFSVGRGRGPGGRAFRNGLIGKLALIALPVSDSVLGTLTANLVAYEAERQPEDAPVWERERARRAERLDASEHVPAGLLDTLTWEPRAIELRLDEKGRVSLAGYAMGINAAPFSEILDRRRSDPWMPLNPRRNGELEALRGRLGPAAWRDSHAVLLGLLRGKELVEAPSVLSAARSRARDRPALALLVGGLVAEGQNTLAGALLSRFSLPPEALDEVPVTFLAGLEQLVADARAGELAARRALGRFASEYHASDGRRASKLGGEMWGHEESAYWATGGRWFSRHVARLAAGEPGETVRATWLEFVRRAASTVVQRATDPYADANGLRAGALARAHLRRHLPRSDQEEAA